MIFNVLFLFVEFLLSSQAWDTRFAAFAVREKCKAGAFIFPHRGPRSGPEPGGLKGGEPAGKAKTVPRMELKKVQTSGKFSLKIIIRI
jgi:hypothetical protein